MGAPKLSPIRAEDLYRAYCEQIDAAQGPTIVAGRAWLTSELIARLDENTFNAGLAEYVKQRRRSLVEVNGQFYEVKTEDENNE